MEHPVSREELQTKVCSEADQMLAALRRALDAAPDARARAQLEALIEKATALRARLVHVFEEEPPVPADAVEVSAGD